MQMFSLEHNHEIQDNKQVQQLDLFSHKINTSANSYVRSEEYINCLV